LSFFHAGPAPKASGPRQGALRDGLDLKAGMRVGLFGGSFNPAHDGHAHVADTALSRLDLDRAERQACQDEIDAALWFADVTGLEPHR